MLSYNEFRQAMKGRIIVDLITRPETIAEMERRSRQHEPAVTAIDRAITDEVGRLNDTERQHAGRMVRDVLAPRGWRPTSRKRLRGSHTFTSGAVYERPVVADLDDPALRPLAGLLPDFLTRADEAVAILAANRRDPSAPVDTVDAFIADRRRMWEHE